MSYFAKLTGGDLSRYVNKIELVGLSKAYSAIADCYRQIGDLTVSAAKCLAYISVPYRAYIMAARTDGIDRMTKLRHCYPMYNILD